MRPRKFVGVKVVIGEAARLTSVAGVTRSVNLVVGFLEKSTMNTLCLYRSLGRFLKII